MERQLANGGRGDCIGMKGVMVMETAKQAKPEAKHALEQAEATACETLQHQCTAPVAGTAGVALGGKPSKGELEGVAEPADEVEKALQRAADIIVSGALRVLVGCPNKG